VARPLGHLNALSSAYLTLDLLARPPGRVNGSGREIAIRPGVLDHGHYPVCTIEVCEFAVGESVCQITARNQLRLLLYQATVLTR